MTRAVLEMCIRLRRPGVWELPRGWLVPLCEMIDEGAVRADDGRRLHIVRTERGAAGIVTPPSCRASGTTRPITAPDGV